MLPGPTPYTLAPPETPEALKNAFESIAWCLDTAILLKHAFCPMLPRDEGRAGIEGLLRPEVFPKIRNDFAERLRFAQKSFVKAETALTAGSPNSQKLAHWRAYEVCQTFSGQLCTRNPEAPFTEQLAIIREQVHAAPDSDELGTMIAEAKSEMCRAIPFVQCGFSQYQPVPERTVATDGTIISYGSKQYSVGGGEPVTVSFREDVVLQAFLKRPAMDHAGLQERTGFADVPRILRDLRRKYSKMFTEAITLPGRKSAGGYRVRIMSANGQQTA